MKKIFSCILAVVMLAFGLTACNNGNTTESSSSASSTTKNENTIEFVQTSLELEIGQSVQAEVITSKKNVPIFWSIRDADIASVSNKGVITALAAGETVCYAEFSGQTAMCLVNVKEESAIPELAVFVPYYDNQVSLYAGTSLNLNPTVKLGDETVADVTVA